MKALRYLLHLLHLLFLLLLLLLLLLSLLLFLLFLLLFILLSGFYRDTKEKLTNTGLLLFPISVTGYKTDSTPSSRSVSDTDNQPSETYHSRIWRALPKPLIQLGEVREGFLERLT